MYVLSSFYKFYYSRPKFLENEHRYISGVKSIKIRSHCTSKSYSKTVYVQHTAEPRDLPTYRAIVLCMQSLTFHAERRACE